MMRIVLSLSLLELGWLILKDIFSPPLFLLDISELLDLFGVFLLVVIAIELLETLKTYLAEKTLHVEVVVEVALIAIARKLIVLDLKDYEPLQSVGIALIIAGLALAYFVMKQHRRRAAETPNP